jgi:hypothetical protein
MDSMFIFLTHVALGVSSLVLVAALAARLRIGMGLYVTFVATVLLVIYFPAISTVFLINAQSMDATGLLTGITTLVAIWMFASLGVGIWGLRKIPVENRRHAGRWPLPLPMILALIALLLHIGAWWFASSSVSARLDALVADMQKQSVLLAPKSVAVVDNAYPLYEQAIGLIPPGAQGVTQYGPQFPGVPSMQPEMDITPEEFEAHLKAMQPALKLADQASQLSGYDSGFDYANPDINPPIVQNAWGPIAQYHNHGLLSSAWASRANARAKAGDAQGAVRDVAAMNSLAEHLSNAPTLEGKNQALSVRIEAIQTMEQVMGHTPIKPELWDALRLSQRTRPRKMYKDAIGVLKTSGTSTAAQIMRGDKSMEDIIGYSSAWSMESSLPYRIFLAENEINHFIQIMDAIDKVLDQPLDQWQATLDQTLPPQIMQKSGMVTQYLVPQMAASVQLALLSETRCRLAELAIAMVKYRQKHGSYPQSLDQLKPEFLKAIPLDPVSGTSLILMTNDGKTVIYGVGRDGFDGGGSPVTDDYNPIGDELFVLP